MNDPDLLADRQAHLLVDSVVDYGIIGFDLDGVITSCNAGAEAIMGWSAEEAIGQPGSMIFVPEDVAAAIPAGEMSAAIRTGRGIDERWHLKKDGSRFWANGEMMPMRREDGGTLKGFVKVMRDRTEQHEAAAASEKAADRLRTLHDEMEEGFCLIEVQCDDDAQPIDYRFIEVNAAFERHTGLKDAAGSWMRELAPDHEQHWFDVYARIARTGKAARFELPARALGRHYEVFAFQVGDPADRVVAILFSDITLRQTEASRLRESEHHLRSLNSLLRGNEANLRLLLDATDEGFYAVDRDGVTTTCNAAFLRMMNYSRPEDAIGRKLHGILHHSHPDGSPYPVEQCPIYRCAAEGTPAHVRDELFFPVGGEPLWVEYRATPVFEDGELKGAICTFRDVTLERHREEERTWTERRRAALLELGDGLRNLQDPAAMAALAAEVVGRTLDASAAGLGRIDAAAETLVIDRDWAVDERFSVAGRHPMRNYGSYIDDLVAGRTVVIGDVGADPRTAASQPSFEAVGVHALINAPVVENGRLAAILCVLSDRVHEWQADAVAFVQEVAERTRAATERRRAEVDLQNLNARLEREVAERTADRNRLWQLSTDLMLVAAFDGTIEAVNPAWVDVLGWVEAELIGQPLFSLIHREDLEHTIKGAAAVSEGTSFAKFENRYRHKDGSYRDIVWTARPGDDRIIAVGRDATEEKAQARALAATEGQLRQAQKMEAVGQLTGGLAHDFNNLLTAVTGGLELLGNRLAAGQYDKVDRYMNMAMTGAQRAAALTQRLLAFSRRQTLAPTATDTDKLVVGMMDIIDRTLGPAIELKVEATAGLWPVLVDAPQLENALLNLCINARDAMPDGGRLTIETSNKHLDRRAAAVQEIPPGDYVSLCVTDTGTGMPPEVIERVFDPFFTTKPLGEGTGLGLSMIYGFVRQSGGQVRIYSEVGHGTTMCLYLPRLIGAHDLVEDAEGAGARMRAEQGQVVLLVEDEVAIRELVAEVLGDAGYRVLTASTGPEGAAVLQSQDRIDLLITDVGLPGGLNGRQVADAGRAVRADLKVLFVTGYAANAAVGAGQLEPGMSVLTKPFNILELERRVGEILAG